MQAWSSHSSGLLVNLACLIQKPTGISTYALNLLPQLKSLHPTLLTNEVRMFSLTDQALKYLKGRLVSTAPGLRGSRLMVYLFTANNCHRRSGDRNPLRLRP